MFLAQRDIRFAKGRFALMGAVVALITLLLVMLSGLTAGLGNQSVSAIANLAPAADAIVFGAPEGSAPEASYTESEVTAAQLQAWQGSGGVMHAEPFGIAQTRLSARGSASVAVFGAVPGGRLAPAEVADGALVLSRTAAEDLDAAAGHSVELGGRTFEIAAIAEDQWYSHTPVAWTSLADWQRIAHIDDGAASSGPIATALAVELADGKPDGTAAQTANRAANTVTASVTGSFQALGSFKSENGSLVLMQGFLYGISALVIVAFLTVWTIQRTRDIAVLKAMGATNGYLMRDALAQAGLVLGTGAATGGLAGVLGGLLAAKSAPFLLTAASTLVPIAGIILLGMAGAALAVRRVTGVDPLTALGGN